MVRRKNINFAVKNLYMLQFFAGRISHLYVRHRTDYWLKKSMIGLL